MSINKAPYTGTIYRAYDTDIQDDSQGYRTVLTVTCDIETMVKETTSVTNQSMYNYTHKVWIWNDAKVVFNGVETTWKQYLSLEGRTAIKEGFYFRVNIFDKQISGEIKLYAPSQMGVMLGIDTDRM